MWDFAGAHRILYLTASWCAVCIPEASELQDRTLAFVEETGIPFSYMIVLYEDIHANAPDGADATAYAEEVSAELIPVLSSLDQTIMTATPWDPMVLPGKCLLSPDLTILDCKTGHGDDEEYFDIIQENYP